MRRACCQALIAAALTSARSAPSINSFANHYQVFANSLYEHQVIPYSERPKDAKMRINTLGNGVKSSLRPLVEALEARQLYAATLSGLALINANTDQVIPGYASIANGATLNLATL